jgi:hypothetical protein
MIATFDMSTSTMRMETPDDLCVGYHNGNLLHFKHQSYDLAVTATHRMVVQTRHRSDWQIQLANDLSYDADRRSARFVPMTAPLATCAHVNTFRMPASGKYPEGRQRRSSSLALEARIRKLLATGMLQREIAAVCGCSEGMVQQTNTRRVQMRTKRSWPERELNMDAWLRFLGWWLAEGDPRGGVCQSSGSPNLPDVQQACRESGFDGTESLGRMWRWQPVHGSRQLVSWLHKHCGLKAPNKHVPRFVFDLDASQQMLLLKALVNGDGAAGGVPWDGKSSATLASKSRRLADDAQQIALACGLRASVRPRPGGMWGVQMSMPKTGRRRLPAPASMAYDGLVYCFTTHAGTMITRRNGWISITGNSYQEAWDISQHVQREAQRRKLNMVVDGIGNTSPKDMLGRVKSFKDAGYGHAEAHYATRDIDGAVETTMYRATKPSAKPESRRFIPEPIIRSTHRDVAASLPGIIKGSKGLLDSIHVYDTSSPPFTDAEGTRHYPDPHELASATDGKLVVHDRPGWEKALGRANEHVPGVDAGARPDTDTAFRQVQQMGLNAWPERSKLAATILGSSADTQHLYAGHGLGQLEGGIVYSGIGGGMGAPEESDTSYSAQRKPLHDKIIGQALADPVSGLLGTEHPIVKKLKAGNVILTDDETRTVHDAAFAARHGENPDFLFLAGGAASGKSSALAKHPELKPEHALTLDPDSLMEQLPEYKRLRDAGDGYAAPAGHEEASDLSGRLQRHAEALGLNLVADGVGNSGAAQRDSHGHITRHGKFASKMIAANDHGYNVSSLFVTVPTRTAQVRAARRALGDADKTGTGRLVPLPLIAEQHASVSRNFPEVAELPFMKSLRVVDTSGTGPQTIIHGSHGKYARDDVELASQFLAKAHEEKP